MLLTVLDFYIKASDAALASLVPRNTPRDTTNHFESVFIMSIRKSVIALSLVLPALSVFALDQGGIVKSVPLKDGSTVHQFKDGKMAMEDKYGRAIRMKEGQSMDATDGTSITMNGDEVAKLSEAIRSHNRT